jgi:hypothetical protein
MRWVDIMRTQAMLVGFVLVVFAGWAFGGDSSWLDKRYNPMALDGQTAASLRLLRNEIFARHGRSFQSKDLQDFFNNQAWYRPDSNYSDAQLSEKERSLVKLIAEMEQRRTTGDFEGAAAIRQALEKITPGGGIPTNIGNVYIGQPEPKAPIATMFLGLPGELNNRIVHNGKVVRATFHVGIASGWDDVLAREKLIELLSKQMGGAPTEEFGNQVWRDSRRGMHLSEFAASGDSHFYITINSEEINVPGSKNDGLNEFLVQFKSALAAGPEAASRYFSFPFSDHNSGADDGPFTCPSKTEFVAKFLQFQNLLHDSPADISLSEQGSYIIRFGYHFLSVEMIEGKWKATGFVYTG